MPDSPTDEQPWYQTELPVYLRFGIAGLLLGPAVSKFVTYERSVQFFAELGLPSPEMLVLVVGAAELVAAVLLLLDRRPRVAALLVIPIMVVAALTAGVTWQNTAALVAALVLSAIETYDGTPEGDSQPMPLSE